MSWVREYKLVIGFPVTLTSSVYKNGKFQKTVDMQDYLNRKDTENAFVLSGYYDEDGGYVGGLNISFDISKDDSASINNCDITIYNLSDATVNYMYDNLENNIAVRLDAGYRDDGTKTIFTGYVDDIEDSFDTDTRQTKLTFGDGTTNIAAAHTSRTYPAGTKMKKIITDVAGDTGLPIAEVDLGNDDETVNETTSGQVHYVGPTIQILKEVCHPRQIAVHVQNGKVHVKHDNSINETEVAYISPETTLIGSPQNFTHTKKKPKGQKTAKRTKGVSTKVYVQGVKFKCFMNGAIEVGSTIYLKSKRYDGQFKISKVTFSGDLEGGDWCCECEAVTNEYAVKKSTKK